MGIQKPHKPVKLIISIIFKNIYHFDEAKSEVTKKFGEIDFESELLPFNHTNYYEKEFGSNLSRKIISFKNLIKPEILPDIKIFTNNIEKKMANIEKSILKRVVNIDPGFLDENKLILATTKNYFHRIYIRDGIFEEVTLYYSNKKFNGFFWTYPDYKSETYTSIFDSIRKIYKNQLKTLDYKSPLE